jgi:hypothetical protein
MPNFGPLREQAAFPFAKGPRPQSCDRSPQTVNLESNAMSEPTKFASSQDSFAPARGLRMVRQMSVPGICRGALTHWPQLHAAIAELGQDPASQLARPHGHGLPTASLIGGAAQLRATLANDPTYLLRPTPPADLYARFAWLTLHVYQLARTYQLTLQSVPDLLTKNSAADPALRGAWVKELLSGPTGLSRRARELSGQANDFAQQLHAIGGDLGAAQAARRASAAVAATQETAPAQGDDDLEHTMGAYARARSCEQEAQLRLAWYRLDAAKVTALAIIANMTSAVETLAAAWQITLTQLETVTAGDASELGNLDFLNGELHLEMASKEWEAFASVIQNFIQRLLIV